MASSYECATCGLHERTHPSAACHTGYTPKAGPIVYCKHTGSGVNYPCGEKCDTQCVPDAPPGLIKANPARTVLDEASEIIHGARQQQYGGPAESFGRIANLWTDYLGLETPLTGHDVAMLMILLKVSRSKNGIDQSGRPQRDSIVDIVGYAGCAEILGLDG